MASVTPRARPAGAPRARRLGDAALVAALAALALVALPLLDQGAASSPRAVGVALVLVAAGATAVRGRLPRAAALVAVGAVGAYLALSFPYGPVFAFVVLPVYALARVLPLRRAAVVAAACLLLLWAHLLTNEAAVPGLLGTLPAAAWVAVPFTVGAARRAVVAADARERAATERQLVAAERLRVAQEVHDVVGHGLAAIQMQADVALHVHGQRPEQAREALAAISAASHEALTDLRETLRVTHPDGEETATRGPTPGLAAAGRLCERVRSAGVHVDLRVLGEERALPPAVDVAAYRVLQEALTNVVRHSAHPRADVRIGHGPGAVTLEVTNLDLDAEGTEPGLGILGMERRTRSVGGTFEAGATSGAFTVRATFPRRPEGS